MIFCYEYPGVEKAIRLWKNNPEHFKNRPFALWVAIKPDDRETFADYLNEFATVESLDMVREIKLLKCRIVSKYSKLLDLRDALDIYGNRYYMEVLK